MKTYAEKRFFKWVEDDVSVSLRASSGSYGGGSEVLVLESNQNHARAEDTEVCPTLPASMGLGGGYVPMIVEPIVFRDDITIKIDGGGHCLYPWCQRLQRSAVCELPESDGVS